MPLGTEVSLGQGDIVLDGDTALPPPERGTAAFPAFRPMPIVAKRSPISATDELLLPTPRAFGAFVGVTAFEFCRDLRRQKTKSPWAIVDVDGVYERMPRPLCPPHLITLQFNYMLSCGVVCVILSQFQSSYRTKDFSRSPAVTNTVKVVTPRKPRCKIATLLLPETW